jgi:hypothetical protein
MERIESKWIQNGKRTLIALRDFYRRWGLLVCGDIKSWQRDWECWIKWCMEENRIKQADALEKTKN